MFYTHTHTHRAGFFSYNETFLTERESSEKQGQRGNINVDFCAWLSANYGIPDEAVLYRILKGGDK